MKNKHYPISVEKLAAFLDGNLPDEEMKRISGLINEDDVLRAVVDVSDSIEDTIASGGELLPDYSVDEIVIPDISGIEDADLSGDGLREEEDNVILRENVEAFLESEENYLFEDSGDSFGDESASIISETDNNTSEAMSTQKIYGYEPNYELDKFDPLIFQGYQPTCAIRSQQIVLRDYGIMLSQEQLKEYALSKGWFDPDPDYGGTRKEHVGNLLDACGIQTTRMDGATIYNIITELRAGHRVIVGVDADELWIKNEPSLLKRLFGETMNKMDDSLRDLLGLQGANHALIVAGVSVNPSDPSDTHVTLIDPGTGDVCIEYDWKDFEDAWSDGNHSMIATNEPAPFQYNYVTHQMEPSGFTTDFIPAKIEMPEGLDNTFTTLPEAFYSLCPDEPAYSEANPISYGLDKEDTDEGTDNRTEEARFANVSPCELDNAASSSSGEPEDQDNDSVPSEDIVEDVDEQENDSSAEVVSGDDEQDDTN